MIKKITSSPKFNSVNSTKVTTKTPVILSETEKLFDQSKQEIMLAEEVLNQAVEEQKQRIDELLKKKAESFENIASDSSEEYADTIEPNDDNNMIFVFEESSKKH